MIHSAPAAPKATTFTLALATIALRAVSRIFTALKNRRQIAGLADLDDRALKDIGLIRSDIDAALTLPLHYDPSLHLKEVSGHGMDRLQPATSLKAPDLGRVRRNDAALAPVRLRIAGL
jgi:uncharacterized protein YjiS (DUF1127 family)